MEEKRFTLPELGYSVVLGKYAEQADGAAWVQQGGTIVLATVVSATSSEFPGFLPLTVDYREQFSAAGKIPGGFFKREGKFSDREVLTGRLIDRAIRPLFPENFFNSVQILITVYSVDKEHTPDNLALIAASLALSISKIPFLGPVGIAEVARVKGQWIANPKYAQIQESDVRIVVAGTDEGVSMVEGSAQEISESEFIDALFLGHETIKKQVAWQKEIQRTLNVEKEPVIDHFEWSLWSERAQTILTPDQVKRLFGLDKIARGLIQGELKEKFLKAFAADIEALKISSKFLEYVFDTVLRDAITELCFTLQHRIDGRSFEQVRKVTTEVGILPFTHGSAVFNRGKTQALVSVTLGGGQDEARIDSLMGEMVESAFMLHYNFPPFSVGEVRQQRGPGRREIGHGHLAASAIERVLPEKEKFPYTIRVVSDILSSDGSSSMATVCGATMALMNAGVPLKAMVSGVAMGLLQSKAGEFKVLTDIAGIEDAFGLMDFKVAGTSKGITAIQMDIKYKGGLSRSVFEMALSAALKGRTFIMDAMRTVMTEPNKELSSLVPQIVSFKVPTDKIGAIIGTGGKIIREIIDKTSTSIDIEDDGLVKIFGQPGEKLDKAVTWVKTLGGLIERGARYQGTIKRLADFGIFVEIVPGLDGLVHISMIPRAEQEKFMRSIQPGDQMDVEVVDYEADTGRIRLKPFNE